MNRIIIILMIFISGCVAQNTQKSMSPSVDYKDAESHLDSGCKHLSNQSTNKAIQEFDQAIDLCKGQYQYHEQEIYASRGSAESLYYMLQAASEKKSAIVVAPTCADALYFKGYAAFDLGNIEQAQRLVEQAISMSPVNAMYLSELGHVYHTKKNWKKALEIFLKAEEAAKTYSPDSVKAQELARAKRGVGFSLIEMGRLDEAERKFKECLKIDKNDMKAKRELYYIQQVRRGK